MDKKEVTKVKVTMEIEVEDLVDFFGSLECGIIEFLKETKANVLTAKAEEE